jgi:sec-independent protein translocase protein TatA
MDVGPVELLIVLAVVLLLFGSRKLPELAKGMGQAAKEFRSGLHDEPDPEPKPSDAKATETKVVETKVVEAPVDAPAVEAPAVEAPAVEAPAVDAPAVDAPAVDAKPDPSA